MPREQKWHRSEFVAPDGKVFSRSAKHKVYTHAVLYMHPTYNRWMLGRCYTSAEGAASDGSQWETVVAVARKIERSEG